MAKVGTTGMIASGFRMHSTEQFVNDVVADLAGSWENERPARKCVLVLLPVGVDKDEVWSVMRGQLERRTVDYREVAIGALDPHPATALGRFFEVVWDTANSERSAEELQRRARSLPDLLYLDGFEELPFVARKEWLEFISDWAQLNQGRAMQDRKMTALCVCLSAADLLEDLPATNILLAIHRWWGMPSKTRFQDRQSYFTVLANRDRISWLSEAILEIDAPTL